MKLKYYLRGLGIGIIAATVILMIAFSQYKNDISDEEIIRRAEALGMVMEDDLDPLFGKGQNTETQASTEAVTETELPTEAPTETETEIQTEAEAPAETPTETEASTETENQTETTESADNTENAGVATGETYHLVIVSGAVPRLICAELEENGVIEDAAALRQYLSDIGYAKSIVTGEYDIPYGASNEEIYQILKAGPNR